MPRSPEEDRTSLAARLERRLCPDAPCLVLPYAAPRTQAALGAWMRRHRLLVAAGLLNGLAQPFFRPYDDAVPGPAPAREAYLECIAALSREGARDTVDAARMQEILDGGERAMESLRAFEARDLRRMYARRIAAMGAGSLLALSLPILAVPVAIHAGEAWAMALVAGWAGLSFAFAMAHELIVVPRLRATA